MPTTSSLSGCYSRLAGDADLADVIEAFVAELPSRLAAMRAAAGASDWDNLGRLAHQLKGAGGSHGFDSITPLAYRLERAARQFSGATEVQDALAALCEGCAALRAGQPE